MFIYDQLAMAFIMYALGGGYYYDTNKGEGAALLLAHGVVISLTQIFQPEHACKP